MKPLTPRERRLVAVGLFVLAVGLVYLGLVRPLVGGFFDRAAERQRLSAELATDDRLIAALPVWRRAAEAQRLTAPRFSIAAPSESLATEALKEKLEHIAADEGFTLSAIDDQQADAPPGVARIRADMTLTLTQLTDTLRRLQNEGAYVAFDDLSISADRALLAGRLSPLGVRLELTAAYRQTTAARAP